MNFKFVILFIISIGLMAVSFISCHKEEQIIARNDVNYFPLEVGDWSIYNVDSFYYDDFYIIYKY